MVWNVMKKFDQFTAQPIIKPLPGSTLLQKEWVKLNRLRANPLGPHQNTTDCEPEFQTAQHLIYQCLTY